MSHIARASTAVSVLTSSTVVAGNNPGRLSITVVNDGSFTVYLDLATDQMEQNDDPIAPTATANSGIRLNANGGSWTETEYSGPVAGIASGGTSVCTVAEV